MKTFKFTNPQFTILIEVETDLISLFDDNMTIHDIKPKIGDFDAAVAAGFRFRVPDVITKGDLLEVAEKMNADLVAIDGAKGYSYPGRNATPLAITTVSLPDGDDGVPYDELIEYEGGTEPVKLSLDPAGTTLPLGLDFNEKENKLQGAPGADGDFSITIDAIDAFGQKVSENFILTINP